MFPGFVVAVAIRIDVSVSVSISVVIAAAPPRWNGKLSVGVYIDRQNIEGRHGEHYRHPVDEEKEDGFSQGPTIATRVRKRVRW